MREINIESECRFMWRNGSNIMRRFSVTPWNRIVAYNQNPAGLIGFNPAIRQAVKYFCHLVHFLFDHLVHFAIPFLSTHLSTMNAAFSARQGIPFIFLFHYLLFYHVPLIAPCLNCSVLSKSLKIVSCTGTLFCLKCAD